MYTVHTFSYREIIAEIFRKNSSLSFVFLFWVDWHDPRVILPGQPIIPGWRLRTSYLANPDSKFPLNEELEKVISRLASTFSQPVLDASNASRQISFKSNDQGQPFGGYGVSDNWIKLPSRALTEVLAGQMNTEEFFRMLRFRQRDEDTKDGMWNQFDRILAEGRMIKNIRVEKCEDDDDDWIVFEFGEPDPALSQFITPGSQSSSD